MALSISLQQEVLALLFVMVVSNLIEFVVMRDYGLRARMLAVLFVDHIYVLIAWAFRIDYSLFYLYFVRVNRVIDVTADFVLNLLFISTEVGFIIVPYLFPELAKAEESVFRKIDDGQMDSEGD
jgi:uncharacterized transporter YbjL